MKAKGREKRHKRIRTKLKGDENKPRMVVFRSKKHIYAQLINDRIQQSIIGCSTLTKEFHGSEAKGKKRKTNNKDAAKEIGKFLAQKAAHRGIKEVCFDRGGYKYHGRVRALAEGAREAGLRF
ncbi:MAG: 50S ribosomal protein L18 [Candidatus Omnitrophota bacterium]|nr:MAG: 50S ribosomal protein L18 [Candidatus Omnitrophota bacterium]